MLVIKTGEPNVCDLSRFETNTTSLHKLWDETQVFKDIVKKISFSFSRILAFYVITLDYYSKDMKI